MKKLSIIMMMLLFILTVTGCGTVDKTGDTNPSQNGTKGNNINTGSDSKVKAVTFKAEVIENKETLLIAPDKDSNEYKSSDKMTVNLTDTVITDKDGKKITKEEIKQGDRVEITYNGLVLESYPAQIGAATIKVLN